MTTTTLEIPPAVAKAQKVAADWTEKAQAAREEAQRVDRDSGAQILDNPAAAEKITLKVQTLERQARAYDTAAAEARSQESAAWRKAVEAEARDLDKLAVTLRKDAEKHRAEVDKLLAKLRALDGVNYAPKLGHAAYMDNGTYVSADDSPRESKGQDLEDRADGAELQAKMVRRALETGRTNGYEGQSFIGQLDTPPVLAAALNAGAL